MAQRKPEKEQFTFDQILQLVDHLSPDQQEQLRLKLNSKSWGPSWDALVQKVEEQSKGLPQITEDEVAEEVMAYRTEQQAKRAQGSN